MIDQLLKTNHQSSAKQFSSSRQQHGCQATQASIQAVAYRRINACYMKHLATHIEGPKLPQEIESALSARENRSLTCAEVTCSP